MKFRDLLSRHPLVRDAMAWALPAIVLGALLRALLLSYSPHAYWGTDSESYFSFSYQLLNSGDFSLYEKRRYFYPIFLLPVTLLPGPALIAVAWIQHLIGLATLAPLAYVVRKSFRNWRWWILPVTVLYAGLPLVIWYEHELLAEALFFSALIWAMAGWSAWVNEKRAARAQTLFWWFFVPFAIAMLTKPAGRFFWPGIAVALVVVAAWRFIRWRQIAALGALFAASLTIGQETQGAWLLYSSAFPLTRLDTPLHAEYKEQIRDRIELAREHIGAWYTIDGQVAKQFLKRPGNSGIPLWEELGDDDKLRTRIYSDLAKEGIFARPDLFVYIALQRVVDSANLSEFKERRFGATYFPDKFEPLYEKMRERKPEMIPMLFGLRSEPPPDFAEVRQKIAPRPESWGAQFLQRYANQWQAWSGMAIKPGHLPARERTLDRFDVTPLGWWVLAAIPLALLLPRYRHNLGAWTIVMLCYLPGVFLVGGSNPRFFAPAWPVVLLLLAVPADAIASAAGALLRRLKRPRPEC